MSLHYKDDILHNLSLQGNIAQFVSFSPQLEMRYFHISNYTEKKNLKENIELAISQSSEERVNVRSFHPEQPKGHPFVYGLTKVDEILGVLHARANEGLFTIVNETIDTHDNGVSGVALGDIIEFTPHDTPKGVDKPGVCSLPRELGINILENVYGFLPNINYEKNIRVEFSVHPTRRGLRNEHTIIWELEKFEETNYNVQITWPNNFSKHIGDKVFGILLAHHLGFKVPKTWVINRNVAPFVFGADTGLKEKWIRTAPVQRTPGKYSTFFGWKDPFKLMANEDPNHENIATVISQLAVDAKYSGSLITDENDAPFIEGVVGRGDEFMVGKKNIDKIPEKIIASLKKVFHEVFRIIGPIEMEWVYDGNEVWIVQLHHLKNKIKSGNVIYEGNPNQYLDYNVSEGLEGLRELISEHKNDNIGINIIGNVGITSHFGDILRKAKIPSIIIK